MMKIILAALLVALILIAGCTTPQQPKTGNASGGTPSGGTPSGGTPSGGTPSGGTSVKSYPECAAECNSIASDLGLFNACKSGCAIDSAKANKDANVCENIKPLPNATLYYVGCLSGVAEAMGNVGPCDRLTNSTDKDWCIVMSAEKIKDPSICDGIVDSMMKSVCIDDTNKSK